MKPKILVDTNILLDVFAKREPFYSDSVQIWTLAETNKIRGYVSAISYNNINYIMQRLATPAKAKKAISLLRDSFETVSLDQKIINMAIDSKFKDFEDAIQYFSAVRINANYIITRNKKDFKGSDIPLLTPEEFLNI